MAKESQRRTTEIARDDLEALIIESQRAELPSALGPCVLLDIIAESPFCGVYYATSNKLEKHKRLCVVKRVHTTLSAEPNFEQRFSASMRRLVHLSHRNVAQVFDTGKVEGVFYSAREYVPGCTLEELIEVAEAHGVPIPLDLGLHILVDLLRGLYHALRQVGPEGEPLELWHGRLRPRSVLLSENGEIKIIGFDREWEPFRPESGQTESAPTMPAIHDSVQGLKADVYVVGCLLDALLQAAKRAPSFEEHARPFEELLLKYVSTATNPDVAKRPADVGALLRPLRALLHRVNPRCGPRDLAAFVRRALGQSLNKRLAYDKTLLDLDAGRAQAASAQSTRKTNLLLHKADEEVRERAVDRAVARTQAASLVGPLPGTKYRILRPIGEGGMATVYAAEHVDLQKVFALKIMHKSRRQSTWGRRGYRLKQEARAVSRLRHPNIVNVSDFGETPDGRVFFVMEHLEGQSFGDLLSSKKRLSQERLLGILIQVCDGLAAAHAEGMVHRDIKPDNIFLVPSARGELVKLVDFGVALVGSAAGSRPLRVAGTPQYMPPELILLQPVDGRSDLYSLGIVAYEALTGKRPFAHSSLKELLRMHVEVTPPPLRAHEETKHVHPAFESSVMRALKKQPSLRQSSAEALGAELRNVRDLLLAQKKVSSIPPQVIKRSESVMREIDQAWSSAVEDFLSREKPKK